MKLKHVLLVFLCLVIGAINGLLGGGGGMLCVPMLQFVCALDEKHSHATAILIMLLSSIASTIIYIRYIGEHFWVFVAVLGGSLIGGLLGAKLLKKLKNIYIQILFIVVLFVAGISMLVK